MIPPEQDEIARFLTALAGQKPVETHISAVFVGHDTVWKLKKAVRTTFLDFTAIADRHRFLMRELELNQPAAPEIYRDVIAIGRQADGTLALGANPPLDWVLRMAPIPKDDFLDAVAARGALSRELLDALGDTIAAYHQRLPPVAGRDNSEIMLRITEGNVQSAHATGLPSHAIDTWQQQMVTAIKACADWLADRSQSGWIRRCHGDLHLGNLCLWHGKPEPFDALEFNEDLATVDVAYDLAFLIMDLDQKAGRPAANQVMNRYIARSNDIAVAGFPIFLSQRAFIRAHVLKAMGQDDAGLKHLAAALDYLKPAPPVILAIGGLQGSGKSTLARAAGPLIGLAPGAVILRSDEIRKRLHGLPPEARLPASAYLQDANEATNDALLKQIRVAASSGQSVIVDATFLDLVMRDRVAEVARLAGLSFVGVWLQAPLAVLEERVAARSGDASDATVAVLHRSAANDPGAGNWLTVDATRMDQALATVLDAATNAVG